MGAKTIALEFDGYIGWKRTSEASLNKAAYMLCMSAPITVKRIRFLSTRRFI